MKMHLSLVCGLLVLMFNLSAFSAPEIIEAGPHHRVWQTVTLGVDEDGKEFAMTNSFTEVATGLNFLNAKTGQYEASQEKFDITPTGYAVALKGQQQLVLAPNINAGGS